ncbi:MAG: hypothetical protein FJX71_00855 [Alphaproteobacteria bacterium]|nr:hypothetical protein [Alphaproteobacteria bacterium]
MLTAKYPNKKIPILTTLAFSAISLINEVKAGPIDPLAFCASTCRTPGPCTESSVRDICKKSCGDVWKIVAQHEIDAQNQPNSGHHGGQMDNGTRMYNSSIASCLEVKPEVKPQERSSLPPAPLTAKGDDLCATALSMAMSDMKRPLQGAQMPTAGGVPPVFYPSSLK